MGQVLSLADARAERVKAKLRLLAGSRSRGMVETPHGLIDARRIFCRDAAAVLIDRYGVQTRLPYHEIADVCPVLPVAEIVRLADWQVVAADARQAEPPVAVLRFPARGEAPDAG
jgi:hypothetical protein